MKLTISNKYTSLQSVNATVEVEAERGKTLCSVCTMDLSVPLVEGKLIDHYDEDLKAKAREVISQMHSELVCGGCMVDVLSGIKPSKISKELLDRIPGASEMERRITELEKKVSGDPMNAIYSISNRAAREVLANWRISKIASEQEEAHRYECSFEISVNGSEPPLRKGGIRGSALISSKSPTLCRQPIEFY